MSLNQTASADRIHVSFFGLRNSGKSSLVNAVTGQNLAVVSDVKGTTTDPVKKAMELLPLGPVVITDTPGFDDEGELGQLRVKKTREVLRKTDIAVLVTDIRKDLCASELEMIEMMAERKLPLVLVRNKADLAKEQAANLPENVTIVYTSALTGDGIGELKEVLPKIRKGHKSEKRIIGDLLEPGDTVVLVVPIDEAAPKGRLILPQQQTIRDILDSGGRAIVCQPEELAETLELMKKKPAMVVTDSQAFKIVSKIVPEDINLTSFSILFARYKGELEEFKSGLETLSKLKGTDKVLISEGCTHHRQCNDIGTVKLPNWIREYCGENPEFVFSSGTEFPEDLSEFSLVVHCGGCMLNEKEVKFRMSHCTEQGVPLLNYGMTIAEVTGILERSLQVFKS